MDVSDHSIKIFKKGQKPKSKDTLMVKDFFVGLKSQQVLLFTFSYKNVAYLLFGTA